MANTILISVKPEFASQLIDGSKTIELRKSAPKAKPGDLIVVYSTYPEMAIVGYCVVKEVIDSTPETIWNAHSSELGIDKKRYFEYYEGRNRAIGIVVKDSQKLPLKISLSRVRQSDPSFSPPQTFKYLSQEFLLALADDENLESGY